MLYKFVKNGKQINSAIAESEKEAIKICGLAKDDYDAIDTEELQPEKETETSPSTKTRKTRIDKGQTRGKKITETPAKEKLRKNPGYFIYSNQTLSKALTHDKAIEAIQNNLPETPRIIMGHEISFTRKIQFKQVK